MPFEKVENLNIYFELEGQGQPVVFISGMTMNHLPWKAFQVPAFIDAGYQCLVLDNRDTGQTGESPDSQYSTAQLANDTVSLMNSLGLEKAHIVGYSMGGLAAQHIAINHPKRVSSMVLLGATARVGAYESSLLKAIQAAKESLSNEDFWHLMSTYILTWRFHENEEGMQRWLGMVTSDVYTQSSEALSRQVTAILEHDTTNNLSKINAPTLIITGEEDMILPIRHSEFLHQKIPGSEFQVIPECGHSGLSEGAATFNPVALEFLAKH